MSAKILGPVGLTVDELIVALQKIADDGQGQARVHALLEGDATGPVRSALLLSNPGDWHNMTVLLEADGDEEARGKIHRVRGTSLAGERTLHTELAGLCAARAYLKQQGRMDNEAAVGAAIARYTRDYAEQLGGRIEPLSDD